MPQLKCVNLFSPALPYLTTKCALWAFSFSCMTGIPTVGKETAALNEERQQPRIVAFIFRHRNVATIASVVVLLIVAGVIYWLLGRGKETTDDAQITGHLVMVTARVAGHVRFVTVDDTDRVRSGQLLVQIDRRDLSQILQKAEADLAFQIAQTAAAASQVSVTEHTAPSSAGQAIAATAIAQQGITAAGTQLISAEAQVVSDEASLRASRDEADSARTDVEALNAEVRSAQQAVNVARADVAAAESNASTQAQEAKRYNYLYKQGAASKEQYQSVANINISAQSALRSARSRLATAQTAVDQAKARRAGGEALLARANNRITSSAAALKQAQASVRAARVVLSQSRSRLQQAQAAEYGTQTVSQQVHISELQRRSSAAKIAQSYADVRAARLNLSYTSIKAPLAGEVASRSVNKGQYVEPGQSLMAIVPLNDVWVVANFKETQIRHMKPGQYADIVVDTYSGRHFRGRVKGIGAASGEQLSLLPPQNATGNFVKVVQRIPIRIVFDQPIPKEIVFRPGQNVIVTVYAR